MAKTYRRTSIVRLFNWLMERLLRLGLGPQRTYLLTVRGRKTGKRYSTPVSLIEKDGARYLVSPYGEVSWVKNARAPPPCLPAGAEIEQNQRSTKKSLILPQTTILSIPAGRI